MKMLFLDFDGVLHPNFSKTTEYFSRADWLIEVLDDAPIELAVIISSSWRFHHPFKELIRYLPDKLRGLVWAVTPEVEPGPQQRYREILAYLARCRGNPDWRALDDDTTGFPKDCRELITCDGRTGLDRKSAKQLQFWLKANP